MCTGILVTHVRRVGLKLLHVPGRCALSISHETTWSCRTSTVEVEFLGSFLIFLIFFLKVLIPAMSTAQDTITQATVDTAVRQEIHKHGHNHEHGVVAHKHVFDMEHMEVALFAAIVGIGAKEGYAFHINTLTAKPLKFSIIP